MEDGTAEAMLESLGGADVNIFHDYNLPPEQELHQQVEIQVQHPQIPQVEGASLLIGQHDEDNNMIGGDQLPIISFKQPIFCKHLGDYYQDRQLSDTVIVSRDGTHVRCHSLILAAASSMMKIVFDQTQDKIMEQEFVLLMPDFSHQEINQFLKPIYGFEDGDFLSNPFAMDFNFADRDVSSIKNKVDQVETTKLYEEYKDENKVDNVDLSAYQGHSILENFETDNPVIVKRKRGRPRKTKHGYLNDDFIDDEDMEDRDWTVPEIDNSDESGSKQKKKRGRPKKIKEEEIEELQHYDDEEEMEETVLEPIVKVKEEEIERSFHEFNEFFNSTAGNVSGESQEISFNQDDVGEFHCEAPNCQFHTFVRASIQQHVRHTHLGIGYQLSSYPSLHRCNRCGEEWSNELYFSRHLTSNECQVQAEKPYVCEVCGHGWFNLTNLTKHIEAGECKSFPQLVTEKHKCNNCDLSFFSQRNREVHIRKAHMPMDDNCYRCAKCDMNFVTHKEFNVHKKSIHSNEVLKSRFQCRIVGCSFETDKREAISIHVKKVHPRNVHICSDCGRNFSDNNKLLQHQASHARSGKGRRCLPVNYTCPQCPREFNRKRHMELHVLFKHSKDRPYSCEQCGKTFKTRHCVNIHLRSHGIGGYSWCCEECGKTFNQISAYHVHLKVHSNIRDFACEDCGMTFKLKHSLKKHQLVHKAEFGHTCDFCGKKFKRSDNLINHRRRHTGEHPYKCDKCSWTGPDSSSFIHHKKKHTEPVHNVHQETKHGPFTNISHAQMAAAATELDPLDLKPHPLQLVPVPPIATPTNIQTIELKPIVSSIQQQQQTEIKLVQTIHTYKHDS